MPEMLRYLILLIFLCFMGATQAASQPTLILTNQTNTLKLSSHLDILEDPQRALSLQQVISPSYATQFYPNIQDTPSFGRTHSAYWARFTLNNQSDLKWYLRINALLGHDVALYVVNNAGQIITDDASHYLSDYSLHAWSLTLPAQENLQFFIRATNGEAIFSLPLELYTADNLVTQTRLEHNAYASLMAALLIMAVYNLLSFFLLRESSYLTLAIHIASVAAIVQLNRPVFTSLDFLNQTDSHFFTAPNYLAVISLLIFCRQLLRPRNNVPKLDLLMRGMIYISIGLMLVTGWIPQGAFLSQVMIALAFPLIIVVSIIRSLQGYRIASYFLLIFLIVTLIVVPNVLINVFANTKWQSSNIYSIGIATLVFLLLLSIVQAERIRKWREAKQKAALSKEAADNFLMTISHELRTPMQALISVGELLQNTSLNSTQKNYLHKQEKASEHMLELVNDMLDLGAITQGKQSVDLIYEPFYLQNLLDDLKKMFSVSAEQKGLTLIVPAIPSSCPPVLGDAKHLKQVLVNLLGNAIKFTEQGNVILTITPSQDPQAILPVAFEVSDTGTGIPVEQQAHLFQPFVQISHPEQQHNGSGLGLAISHQLVKQMGGDLQQRNQTSGGSCFFFTLHLSIHADGKPSEVATPRKKASAMPLQGIKILLIDDDSLNQFFGQKLLTLQGADVQVAGSGQEAIQQAQTKFYDFVLMDLDLPDMNGYKITQAIRAHSNIADSTIIALSAHALGKERENCLKAGMDDYLAKPYKIDELTDIILKHYQNPPPKVGPI